MLYIRDFTGVEPIYPVIVSRYYDVLTYLAQRIQNHKARVEYAHKEDWFAGDLYEEFTFGDVEEWLAHEAAYRMLEKGHQPEIQDLSWCWHEDDCPHGCQGKGCKPIHRLVVDVPYTEFYEAWKAQGPEWARFDLCTPEQMHERHSEIGA